MHRRPQPGSARTSHAPSLRENLLTNYAPQTLPSIAAWFALAASRHRIGCWQFVLPPALTPSKSDSSFCWTYRATPACCGLHLIIRICDIGADCRRQGKPRGKSIKIYRECGHSGSATTCPYRKPPLGLPHFLSEVSIPRASPRFV